MELEEKIERGFRAKEILESEVYIETFDLVKKELMSAWENSPARDTEGREKLYLMLGILNKLQSVLSTTMDTGKLAQADLKHSKSLFEKAKELAGLE
jgi:hypothetical protein